MDCFASARLSPHGHADDSLAVLRQHTVLDVGDVDDGDGDDGQAAEDAVAFAFLHREHMLADAPKTPRLQFANADNPFRYTWYLLLQVWFNQHVPSRVFQSIMGALESGGQIIGVRPFGQFTPYAPRFRKDWSRAMRALVPCGKLGGYVPPRNVDWLPRGVAPSYPGGWLLHATWTDHPAALRRVTPGADW